MFIPRHRLETKLKIQPHNFPFWLTLAQSGNQPDPFPYRVLFGGGGEMGWAQKNNFVHDFHEEMFQRRN